jgi:N-acetylglucosamine-6-phosphate deacetylase
LERGHIVRDTVTTYDLILRDAKIVTPERTIDTGWLGISRGEIAAIESGDPPEGAREVRSLHGSWLGPGFIDVHVHGSVGIDVMDTDEAGFRQLSRFFATRGVTSYLVGTYTLDHKRTLASLATIAKVVGRVSRGASILGAYMEGPYLNPVRKGAHRESLLRAIDRNQVQEYLATGVVRAVAFAPELPDADWLTARLVESGVSPVAGHTDAKFAQMKAAQEAGVVSVTHVFNGMRGIHHREPGAAGASLLLDGLVCEVICDGTHVAPQLMKLFWRMKGAQGIALITDAGPSGGRPDGVYMVFDREVTIADGVGRLDNGTISSSAKTFDHDFALFSRVTGEPFDQVWPTASLVPARIAGVADRKGSIEIGKDADLVVLNPSGAVLGTVVGGEWVDPEGAVAE